MKDIPCASCEYSSTCPFFDCFTLWLIDKLSESLEGRLSR